MRNRVRGGTTPQRDSLRARIILLRAQGVKVGEVARQLGVSVTCVSKWSSRFEAQGLEGLKDAPGRGRKPSLPKEKIEQVLIRVTQPPKGRRRDLHLIVDNYATHKHAKVKAWLERHPRFHIHFTPTGSSWLNLVERFFADITQDAIRDGSFTSVRQLITAIEDYLTLRNEQPRRYQWRAKGEEILAKIHRAREAMAALS
jgi:transposase